VLRHLQASAIPERAITVALELDDSLHVSADEMLLTSAASNLLHNAIKFTRTGGHIVLACRADDDGVVIDVEDECGGLPAGNPRELLEPFVKRGDNPQNFGLGLAITLRATEAMGGTVKIEDIPGHGCIFQLRFPSVPRPPSSRPPPPPED
jgi:signal transduction histidine kinase